MRLVAVFAGLVPSWRRRQLLLVASAASACLLAVMRIVAADAFGVPWQGASHLCRVARATLRDRQERAMRQPRVTTLAVSMPRQGGHLRQLSTVTVEASAVIGAFAHEIVRRVAALAVDASVKIRILGGGLVTAAAGTRAGVNLRAAGMRIVTAHAAAGGPGFGMIRVHPAVALGARLLRAAAHVVWGVAARALLVAGGLSATQHGNTLVTRAARRSLVFGEIVRTMTTHALPMAGVEQRGLRHYRRLLRVTRHARAERFRSRRVLLLVARGASLSDRLARARVGRRHVLVAVGARRRDRFGVLVRPVAVEAFFGVVYLHGGRRALSNQMAVGAVAGRVGVGVERLPARQRFERTDGSVFREAVAKRAVALGGTGETRLGLVGRVRKLRLLVVTLRAALGVHRADLAFADGVAVVAGHVLLHDVYLMTADLARRRPTGRNIDAQTRVGRA